ncbi:CBS domain-containing protein CBSX1, chloroplastic-like isoform X3 [Primulina huaijiensis]
MTKREDLHVVKPATTVNQDLEILVEKRITGFPVIDGRSCVGLRFISAGLCLRLLLQTKYNLLSVVNGDGKLVGIITLGNVVRAALQFKQDEELRSLSICKKLEVRHTTHARKRFREFERTSGEANVSY